MEGAEYKHSRMLLYMDVCEIDVGKLTSLPNFTSPYLSSLLLFRYRPTDVPLLNKQNNWQHCEALAYFLFVIIHHYTHLAKWSFTQKI